MKTKGPWSTDEILHFLRDVRVPIRVACNGAEGHPVLASLWFLPRADTLWCATQRGSSVASLLRRDPRCAFEISLETPPYRGVRGAALATLHDGRGEEMLRELLERYLGDSDPKLSSMLLSRASSETAIAIEPQTLLSWDYRDRMAASA